MHRLCPATCLALALVWLLGCGGGQQGAAPVAKVKGTVTLDGKPLPAGEVYFGLTGVPSSAIEIKDGAFSGEAPVGKTKVEVFVYVEGPATEKHGGTRNKTNVAPKKYWGPNTTLSATVGAGEPNEFKFDLASK
ncbi:MAG: hypothetical protein J0I06_02215 [Planctomycetes bacterium]|nr:hypothetical protein [Planctomycetota bacterium]